MKFTSVQASARIVVSLMHLQYMHVASIFVIEPLRSTENFEKCDPSDFRFFDGKMIYATHACLLYSIVSLLQRIYNLYIMQDKSEVVVTLSWGTCMHADSIYVFLSLRSTKNLQIWANLSSEKKTIANLPVTLHDFRFFDGKMIYAAHVYCTVLFRFCREYRLV